MAGVRHERRDGVAVLTLDNPPVNGLALALRASIAEHLEADLADPEVRAIVIAGAGRMFCGGADMREFGDPTYAEGSTLPDLIDLIESAPKPVIAAMHGVAAGGGLELALGCHHRLAAPGTRLGQPEVTLGIIPGAGGTQRLPRLIGIEPALDIIVGGALIPAERAHAQGLVDELVDGDLVAGAVAFAGKVAAAGTAPRRTRDLDDKIAAAKPEVFADFRKGMARRARGLKAPYACVDAIEGLLTLPFAEALARERRIFVECLASEQSKALRHVFFAERQAAKVPDVPADTPARSIEAAAVIGCGTMGGGIAMNFANAGIPVRVIEAEELALARGRAIIERNYASTVSKGRLSQAEMDARLGRITGSTSFEDAGDADIVIEAVFEDMALKMDVFARLDKTCKADAVLATNTSTLDVNEIAAATTRPEAVIGTHFFSPANVMRLMENVRGDKTSHETIATVMKLSKKIGKVGVLVGVCDGFVGNRMLYAYTHQAHSLVEEGALPQQVDKVIYDFGFPMGPFAMHDMAGLDVGWRVRKAHGASGRDSVHVSPIADRICEMGRFGQKTGAGWYRYEPGNRTPLADPEIEALIVSVSGELGISRREIGDEEILERCLYPLINEGAKILEEGIALRAGDIDVVWIYGYGFPRQHGGPMFYAERVGLETIHDAMSRLYDTHGRLLQPAPLLARLAKEGKGFADL